ncbi:MAG: hypothetical protein J6T31_05880 [Methanobrevibacter sp.]|nr:hypothetical protein [Methanobrevibacter sp.]
MDKTEPTSPLIIPAIRKEKRNCLCCGKQFEVEPFIIKDFCNRCYPIVCKEVYDESNGKLTCKQLVDKINKEIE